MSNNVFFGNYDLNCFEIKFNKYKVSTCYYEKPFKLPSGVTAFICDNFKLTDPDRTVYTVHFESIKTNIVPACTPCYLKSDESKTYQFWFDETNTDKAPELNYLWGTNKDMNISNIFPEDKYDVLGLGRSSATGEVGWWLRSDYNKPLPAHKAVLPIQK